MGANLRPLHGLHTRFVADILRTPGVQRHMCQELEELRTKGEAVKQCPGCGVQPSSTDIFDDSMRDRIRDVPHKVSINPALRTGSFLKRQAVQVEDEVPKRPRVDERSASFTSDRTGLDPGRSRQPAGQNALPSTNADLAKQIRSFHMAVTIVNKTFEKVHEDVQKLEEIMR